MSIGVAVSGDAEAVGVVATGVLWVQAGAEQVCKV